MNTKGIGYKFFKFSLLTFLMLVSAFNYNLFVNPAKIVAGGTNGISTILESVFNFNPSTTILVLSLVILLISFCLKEYELAISAVLASLIYPTFVEITSNINGIIPLEKSDILIITIFSGIVSGVISGITCRCNISQGGTILISQIINNKFKVSTSKVNVILNSGIVIAGGFVFGATNILYALVYLISSRIIMDKIILGTSQKKLFQIITSKDEEVIQYITNVLNSGVTTFKTKGGFNSKKQTVIMTSITNRDYFKLKEGINKIDKDAFIVITDSYQVKGGK